MPRRWKITKVGTVTRLPLNNANLDSWHADGEGHPDSWPLTYSDGKGDSRLFGWTIEELEVLVYTAIIYGQATAVQVAATVRDAPQRPHAPIQTPAPQTPPQVPPAGGGALN